MIRRDRGYRGARSPRVNWGSEVTRILLTTGDQLEVAETFEEVVKALENASRSSAGTLAQLAESDTGNPIALSAAHVVLVRPGDER